jgi:hypothetical protein
MNNMSNDPNNLRKGCLGKNPCRHYSRSLGRCKLGYVNPKTIKGALWAVQCGLLKPCPFTVRGDKVIKLMAKEGK